MYGKLINHFEHRTHDRDEHHLCETLTRLQRDYFSAAVPGADQDQACVVRVDQPHQVAQHQPLAMPQARPGQYQGCQSRIGHVNGDATGYDLRRCAWRQFQRCV
jgi:hypothetical protein